MKRIILALVLIAVVLGAKSSGNKLQQKRINDLQQSKWGRTLLNFITLHAAVSGPVQELIDAIQELIDDLNMSLQNLEYNFQVRTNEHNALVISLEQDIQDAETDVARSEDLINSLLVPRRSQIQQKIEQINENIAHNRKSLAEETLLREQAHEAYEAQLVEYNDATDSVDDALNLIASLTNPSLLQIKKIQGTVSKIQKKKSISRMKNGPMVMALINLANQQNFSNQGILQEVVNALNEFRSEVVDAINEITANENQSVLDFEERVDQLNAELSDFQANLTQASYDLDATSQKIEETTTFLNQREQDRRSSVAQLELENESYANEVDIYANLKNEYLKELAISEQGYNVINSADFGSSVNLGK